MANTSPIATLDTEVNMEETVLSILSETYPYLDCGPGTPVYELVVRPIAYLWSRQSMGLDELIKSVSFNDYLNMATEDMDRLMSRYFLERRSGVAVEGTVRCTTTGENDIVVYTGEIWETSESKIYEVQTTVKIKVDEWDDIKPDGSPIHWYTEVPNVVTAIKRLDSLEELYSIVGMSVGDRYIVGEVGNCALYEYKVVISTPLSTEWVKDESVTNPILYNEVDAADRVYYFDVTVKSVGVGSEYNAAQFDKLTPTGVSADYIKAAYFLAATNDGGSDETNAEFYNRAKNELAFRGMCSYKSTSAILLDNFDTIKEVVSIGLKDSEMIRDLVEINQPTYTQIVHTLVPLSTVTSQSPLQLKWYEYDSENKTYVLSDDTSASASKTYYINKKSATVLGTENPTACLWYEYDDTLDLYKLTSDITVDSEKEYFVNLYSPSVEGWYQKNEDGDLILSTDNIIDFQGTVYWEKSITGVSTHVGGKCDIYIKPSTYHSEYGYTAPLGFPLTYKSYSLLESPNNLVSYWNNNVVPDLNKNDALRGSLYEDLGESITSTTDMTNLKTDLEDIETFVNNGENTALHTDNMVKQMWPIVVGVNIKITSGSEDDAETMKSLAKQTIKEYINSLEVSEAPQVAELAHILREVGISKVHIPSTYQYRDYSLSKDLPILRAYYLRDSLKMEWIGLNLATSGTDDYPTLLMPTEDDNLKFTINPDFTDQSQISLRTCCWYTDIGLINVYDEYDTEVK